MISRVVVQIWVASPPARMEGMKFRGRPGRLPVIPKLIACAIGVLAFLIYVQGGFLFRLLGVFLFLVGATIVFVADAAAGPRYNRETGEFRPWRLW